MRHSRHSLAQPIGGFMLLLLLPILLAALACSPQEIPALLVRDTPAIPMDGVVRVTVRASGVTIADAESIFLAASVAESAVAIVPDDPALMGASSEGFARVDVREALRSGCDESDVCVATFSIFVDETATEISTRVTAIGAGDAVPRGALELEIDGEVVVAMPGGV